LKRQVVWRLDPAKPARYLNYLDKDLDKKAGLISRRRKLRGKKDIEK